MDQWGGATGSTGEHKRTFGYDSLSRLTLATNPETGTTCYGLLSGSTCQNGYDANGNLTAKQDSRGVVTSFTYDALNRLLSKTSNGALSSCFQYDGSIPNGKGRLAYEWTQTGACPATVPASGFVTLRAIQSYDEMGRITAEQQCTPGGRCTASSGPQLWYGYDLNGNGTCLANSVGAPTLKGVLIEGGSAACLSSSAGSPSGLLVTSAYDSASHLNSVATNWTTYPTNLYSLATDGYGAIGPTSWTLDNNLITVGETYTKRLRVNSILVTGPVP